MKTIRGIVRHGAVLYALLLGTGICLLCHDHHFLSFVENTVDSCFDPLNITNWIWMFLGS